MRGMGTHLIEKKDLSAKGLLTKVRYLFKKISEPQKDPRGLKPKISLVDCLMSALAIFGLKFSSLLHFDEQRTTDIIKHNLKTLYEAEETPCDTNMRQGMLKEKYQESISIRSPGAGLQIKCMLILIIHY